MPNPVTDTSQRAAERIERLAMESLHAGADATLARALALSHALVDGAFVSIATRDPSILLNRTLGLGLEEPATPEYVREIRNLYRAANVERFFLHIGPDSQPPALADWLATAGLVPHRRWMKFARDGTVAATPPSSRLVVRAVDVAMAEPFGQIVAAGFDLSATGGSLVARLAGQPGWQLYMSFQDDEPVGTGALFVSGEAAWCDWAATRPEYRGMGSQRAILARRIEAARQVGCRTIFATTGEAVPGDPQHSYRNLLRAGFRELYLRDNYVPAE